MSGPRPSLDTFSRRDDKGTLYTASLQIVLYAKKPLAELSAGATRCYRIFVERFGRDLSWYQARQAQRARRFSNKSVEIFPDLCKKSEIALPEFRVCHGSGILDYLPPVFATGSYAAFSWLQVHLPPALANNWGELQTLLAALAKPFPFRCGHVGLSLCWNERSVDRDTWAPTLIGPLLKRYPGFSLGTPQELCDQDLPPVSWLTLIGPDLLGELGGTARVRKAISSKTITVAPLGHGIVIRAGELPQLGDRNRKDGIPVYRKVGAYLKRHRGDQEIELDGLGPRASRAWLARFDA